MGFDKEKQLALMVLHMLITMVLSGLAYYAGMTHSQIAFTIVFNLATLNGYFLVKRYLKWMAYS